MKRPGVIAAGCVFMGLVIFALGFTIHFPGEALSTLVMRRLATVMRANVHIEPARFRGLSIVFPRVVIDAGGGSLDAGKFDIRNVDVSLNLFSGAPISADFGENGRFDLYWPWSDGAVTLNVQDIDIESVNLLRQVLPFTVQGKFSGKGRLEQLPAGPPRNWRKVPPGAFEGSMEPMVVKGVQVLGQTLPPMRFERVEFKVVLGQRTVVEHLTFSGDFTGRISGTIQPRLQRLDQSQLRMQLDVTPSAAWLEQLGNLGPVVRGLLRDGRFNGRLEGTLAKPRFKPVRSQ